MLSRFPQKKTKICKMFVVLIEKKTIICDEPVVCIIEREETTQTSNILTYIF